MATYPIKALGQLGVIADLAPTDLPPNAFTDAMNARFVEQRVFKTGGCAPLSYTDADKDITPLSFVSMPFDYYSSGNSFLVVGTDKRLWKLTNEGMYDISRRVSTVTKKATASISIFPVLTSIIPKQVSYKTETGKTLNLEVTVNPDGVRNPNLKWSVSNESYATVEVDSTDSKKAVLTAKNTEGNVVVKVSNEDETIEASIYVTIIDTSTSLFLNKTSTTIRKGGTDTLIATTQNSGNISWASSNNSALSVIPNSSDSSMCTIKGLGEGTYTVTASNGTTSVVCTVNIIPQIDSVRLDYSSLTLSVGTSGVLNAYVTPADAPNQAITWTSSNPNIATVSGTGTQCTIQALVAGITTITATTAEGSRSASCVLYVELSRFSAARNDKTLVWSAAPESQEDAPVETFALMSEPVVVEEEGAAPVLLGGIDTTQMYDGNSFYDYSNVGDMEGFARAAAAAPMATALTGVTLDVTSVQVDVGDEITINAIPAPTDATDLVYQWVVDRSGYVSTTSTTDARIKLTALKSTQVKSGDTTTDKPIKITCTVSQLTQRDYNAYEARPWYHAIISNCAVATTYDEIPQIKVFNQEMFQDLPGWGDQTVVDDNGNASVHKYNWKCERVRAFNNRLFALNMREANASGVVTHYPLRLRWSNFAKENAAPTLWDDLAYNRDTNSDLAAGITGQVEALEDGYAGYIDLADSNGNLMEMLPLKDYLFVYTEFETYVGSPTMNSYQPLMWKKLFNDSGILAPECVCEVEGGHFVVTQNDIILHNGTSKKSLASNRVKDKIINEVCQVNPLATKVHLHQDKKEVWILYVGPGQEKDSWACTKAAVWNYEYDTWSFRTIPFSYCIGLVDPPTLEKGPIWTDFLQISWDSHDVSKLIWRRDANNFHRRIVIVGSFMKGFYEVDTGPYDYTWDALNQVVRQQPLEMRLERTGIDFDNVTNEWNQKHINKFRPQVMGTGKYTFITGGSQYSNEYGHQHSTKDYIIGKDRHVAVRLNHPYLFYNVIDNDVDSRASMNGITIEFVVGGRR